MLVDRPISSFLLFGFHLWRYVNSKKMGRRRDGTRAMNTRRVDENNCRRRRSRIIIDRKRFQGFPNFKKQPKPEEPLQCEPPAQLRPTAARRRTFMDHSQTVQE